jgi:hypothetical protein
MKEWVAGGGVVVVGETYFNLHKILILLVFLISS